MPVCDLFNTNSKLNQIYEQRHECNDNDRRVSLKVK